MNWFIKAIRVAWAFLDVVPVTIRDWGTVDEGGAFLRELATREAVFDACLPGSGRAELSGELKKRCIEQSPQDWFGCAPWWVIIFMR